MFMANAVRNLLATDGEVAVGQLVTVQGVMPSGVGEVEDGKGEEDGPCVLRWGKAAWRC